MLIIIFINNFSKHFLKIFREDMIKKTRFLKLPKAMDAML